MRKLFKILLVSVVVLSLSGCSSAKEKLASSFDSSFYTQLVETYDHKAKPVKDIYDGLKKLDIEQPYTPYGDVRIADSVVMFDILNREHKIVNIQYDGSVFKSKDAVDWDTYSKIASIIKDMVGADSDFTVETTYEKGVLVKAQGQTYTWDGESLTLQK